MNKRYLIVAVGIILSAIFIIVGLLAGNKDKTTPVSPAIRHEAPKPLKKRVFIPKDSMSGLAHSNVPNILGRRPWKATGNTESVQNGDRLIAYGDGVAEIELSGKRFTNQYAKLEIICQAARPIDIAVFLGKERHTLKITTGTKKHTLYSRDKVTGTIKLRAEGGDDDRIEITKWEANALP